MPIESRWTVDGQDSKNTVVPSPRPRPATFGNLLGVLVKRNQPPIFLTDNMSLYGFYYSSRLCAH